MASETSHRGIPGGVPRIVLPETQLTWLRAAYALFRSGKEVTYRNIVANLPSTFPREFEPKGIDERLLKFGTNLTLLGAWHAEPEGDVLEKADVVVRAIRDTLRPNPDKTSVTAAEISEKTGIASDEIARLFSLILPLGVFSAGASRTSGASGWTELQINDDAFREYTHYDGIGNLLHAFFERWDPARKRDSETAWSDEPSNPEVTRVDRWLNSIKNHRVPAIVIVAGIILSAVARFTSVLSEILVFVRRLLGR